MEHVMKGDDDNPEVIATFLDQSLQGKFQKEKLTDDVISVFVEEALNLVRYLVDQDIFLEFYRAYPAVPYLRNCLVSRLMLPFAILY